MIMEIGLLEIDVTAANHIQIASFHGQIGGYPWISIVKLKLIDQ